MEALKIEGNREIPTIIVDQESSTFEISGRSCPENVSTFYHQLFDWIDQYSEQPNPETVFKFRMVYYNSASAKVIFNILQRLEEIAEEGSSVSVEWYYPEDDDDIYESGEEYEEMIEIPVELISYPSEDD